MRIWIDPNRLKIRNMTTQDVIDALKRQNLQVAAGQVGQQPSTGEMPFQLTVTTQGRLSDAEQFERIIVKRGNEGQLTYLRDVARVELGAQSYDTFSSRTGYEAANILIFKIPSANTLEVAQNAREAMERLKQSFPPGMEYSIPLDRTKFVSQAISEVYRTLIEAGLLVLFVILVFLQSWRALFVPATTVPVTIVGAFAFLYLMGFSVNLLTLFGLVLAIGIVVDDAIVIVENASHHIEQGLGPREATIRAMSEVTGPVIAITLVLMAVFVPSAFLGGITGQLYRQFALTIAATALLSAINALTLKPAQCATYLRPPVGRRNVLVRTFEWIYRLWERIYVWQVRQLVKIWPIVLLLFVILALGTGYWYTQVPRGFLPIEDQGNVMVSIQLPDAASLDRTREVVEQVNRKLRNIEGIQSWFVLGGVSVLDGTNTSNAATCFVVWDDWAKRKRPELSQEALIERLREELGDMEEATIHISIPPAIQGLGVTGGFQMLIEDRDGVGPIELQQRMQEIVAAAQQEPTIGSVTGTFRAGVPQYYLHIHRDKAEKMGVLVDDIFRTLQANLGSYYVNDFNRFGRTYQVRIQAEASARMRPEDIERLEVRNHLGKMVPLGTLLTVEERIGPLAISRYNLYPTAVINGTAAAGVSTGNAIDTMERIAQEILPDSMGFDWTGIAFQERRVSGQAVWVFVFAVLLVYLVLAAQYESWLLPLAVILVVPLGLLGVLAAVQWRGFDNNVYTQIGIVLIIALASKNAILIVEFARELRLEGRTIREAAIEASRKRFRPIVMTSFAFILGVVPLVFASGAGAASRQSLGTAVFGGMIASTVLAVYFVPIFYIAVQWCIEWLNGPPTGVGGSGTAVSASGSEPTPMRQAKVDSPAKGTAETVS